MVQTMTHPATRSTDTHRDAPPDIVRAAIARAEIGPSQHRSLVSDAHYALGSLTLLPHQRDAVTRIRAILRELHVALLADDVGLGKTYVALALARDYPHVRIIAPAALLPMWRSALARAQCTHAQLESLQRYSRADAPREAHRPGALVIVDEAHHLRTPSTRRYRAVAEVVTGCDVLLLSATPVHNAPGDLRALLALSLGSQAARLSHALLARLVVRRTQHDGRPQVSERAAFAVPHNPALLNAILSLPAPLPAHDGAVAGALIRLGLLRAWCSSDAALTHALRQRLLRGEALRQALEAGRHPTAAELRTWLVGEHEVQLAFPELLAGHAPATGPLLDVLAAHLDAVSQLAGVHQRASHGDLVRTQALRDIMRAHPTVPIIAFSQFAATIRTIGRALSDIAGVGALTGQRAWIASGSIARHEALAYFAPEAQGRPPPPPHLRIHLLLATDLLAEGVNLQDAGVVVHLDLPWTDALRQQRVGRCVRVGSPHTEVVVYRIEPPPGAEAALRLYDRLERKARWGARLVGASRDQAKRSENATPCADAAGRNDIARRAIPRPSAADHATAIRALLLSWLNDEHSTADDSTAESPQVCVVPAAHSGFIAVVVLHNGTPILVGGRRTHDATGQGRVRVTTSPSRLLTLLQAAERPAGMSHATTSWPRTNRALHRWLVRRALRVDLGDHDTAVSSVHRRVHTALSQAMARSSPMQRVALRDAYQRVFEMLAQARGVAAERALTEWLTSASRFPWPEWLSRWRSWPALAAATDQRSPTLTAPKNDRHTGRIVAAVLFEPTVRGARPATLPACPPERPDSPCSLISTEP